MLGHADISQTSTYLNATRIGLQDAMRRLDASRSKPVENQVAAERSTEQRPIGKQHVTETTQELVKLGGHVVAH
jgi:hypothetical protein